MLPSHNTRRAVFLDRDGTLTRPALPGEHLRAAYEVELLDGAAAAVAMLSRAGYLCVVVSNQRGVAHEDLSAVDARLRDLVAAGGAELNATYYCTHALDDGCDCRKPAPGLILRAARELDIEPAASWMVGDSQTDAEAGVHAGCRTLRVRPVDGALLAAAQTILAHDQRKAA
jgi:D-glycero-D-manno-heptose 1,7-bisphosphate phosphatase